MRSDGVLRRNESNKQGRGKNQMTNKHHWSEPTNLRFESIIFRRLKLSTFIYSKRWETNKTFFFRIGVGQCTFLSFTSIPRLIRNDIIINVCATPRNIVICLSYPHTPFVIADRPIGIWRCLKGQPRGAQNWKNNVCGTCNKWAVVHAYRNCLTFAFGKMFQITWP